MEQVGVAATLLACIREEFGSNSGRDTVYPEIHFAVLLGSSKKMLRWNFN
jgi:hypothetical protein